MDQERRRSQKLNYRDWNRQQAGGIRDDVDTDDVKAIITGCLARDPSARDRMISKYGIRGA